MKYIRHNVLEIIMRYLTHVFFLILLYAASVNSFFVSWRDLHRAAATQPVDEFYETISTVMATFPCEECREHFANLVNEHPFPLENVRTRDDMRIWMWMTHNLVNVRLNKTWQSYDILTQTCLQ